MVALLLACRPDPAAPAGPDGADEADPPYLAPPTTAPPPFDRAAVEAGLADVIALVPTLDAAPAWQVYADLRVGGDELCPPSYPYSGYEYWYAECTAASGTTFTGYAYSYDYGFGDSGWYQALYMAGSVVDPDAGTLASTGIFYHTVWARSHEVRLDGVFDWDGAVDPGTWIARGLVPSLLTTRTRAAGDRRQVTIDGGIAGFPGDPDTFEFTGVEFDTADDCAEPLGTISFRVADGHWLDATFRSSGSNPADDGPARDCDGCAEVTSLGVPVGTVWADFSPWATWDEP
jgi:hypothetical protein